MAPEMLANAPAQIGKNADIWAAGLMATRLLTEYFPFDDVLSMLFTPCSFCISRFSALCSYAIRGSDGPYVLEDISHQLLLLMFVDTCVAMLHLLLPNTLLEHKQRMATSYTLQFFVPT